MTTDPAFLALLQLADGLFPAGGFAHSFGLETYVQEGRVDDAAGLEAFGVAPLGGGAGPCGAGAGGPAAPGPPRRDVEGARGAGAAAHAGKGGPGVRGAGLRLIALGQVQGQRLLARLRPRLARLGSEAAARKVDDLWSFNPGLELAGLRHATLDRRLFRS